LWKRWWWWGARERGGGGERERYGGLGSKKMDVKCVVGVCVGGAVGWL
jgi:hypothetical protein